MKHRSIEEIHAAYRSGELTPGAYVHDRIKEIHRRDSGEEGLHSFIAIDSSGFILDSQNDERLRPPRRLRPLEGVPIAVKDNIDTVAFGCTAGSILLEDIPVLADAPLITALQEAGAIVVGKNNLSEWANFRSTKSSSGWSSVGGQTRNAEFRDRTPCGSSSGGATAVAAGLVPVSIGTETDGSIICPAAIQGCVGFKPSVGRVSQQGIVPISWSQDTAGPISNTVTDAWIVQKVLKRSADIELSSSPQRRAEAHDHHAAQVRPAQLFPAPLRDARIGVFPPGDRVHPETMELYRWVQRRLQDAGASLVPVEPPPLEEIDRAERTVLRYEFPIALERYLSERRPESPYRSLSDLHRANVERGDRILAIFGQEIWDRCLPEKAPTKSAYDDARARIEDLARTGFYDRWFKKEAVDVMIAPANGPAWKIDHINGDRYTGSDTPPAAVTGSPILTVPAGGVRGLPIGIGFYGPPNGDDSLFRYGLAWERLYGRSRV